MEMAAEKIAEGAREAGGVRRTLRRVAERVSAFAVRMRARIAAHPIAAVAGVGGVAFLAGAIFGAGLGKTLLVAGAGYGLRRLAEGPLARAAQAYALDWLRDTFGAAHGTAALATNGAH